MTGLCGAWRVPPLLAVDRARSHRGAAGPGSRSPEASARPAAGVLAPGFRFFAPKLRFFFFARVFFFFRACEETRAQARSGQVWSGLVKFKSDQT